MKWRLALLALHALLAPALAAAQVKLDDAPKAVAEAAAKLDLKTAPFGETLTIETIAPLDPARPVDTKVLRANLAKLKLKILQETAEAIVVEAANGARARIAFDQGGGTIMLTARPANPTLPGKCVPIPDVQHPVHVNTVAIDQAGEPAEGRSFWDLKTKRLHDVDGDGILDAFVPVAKTKAACPEAVLFRVFVVRGACGHDLGVIGPGSFELDAGTSAIDASGFRPFTTQAQASKRKRPSAPVQMTTTTRRFAVKRGKYALVDTKSRTSECHHCATWHCTAP